MKIKVITLSLFMIAGLNLVNGQEKGKKFEPEKRNTSSGFQLVTDLRRVL